MGDKPQEQSRGASRSAKGSGQRIRSSFESLCDRHVLVVVERESLASDEGRFTSFDFLPVAPTDPETMAKMAFNRPTLGEVRIRSLKGRALSSWSMKGEAPDCIERATEFSKGYDLSISLFGNSCEDYATQLVAHLLVE